MLDADITKISESTLRGYCAEKLPESPTLDFKATAPTNDEQGRSEFLKDICAFANSEGGDIVYGIGEIEGVAGRISPLEGDADKLQLRLLQLVDSGIEPRLRISVHVIRLEHGFAIVVRVPAQTFGPFCVINKQQRRFVLRNGTLTSDMTYQQVQDAFGRMGRIQDMARQWLDARIGSLKNFEYQAPLAAGPVCAVHFVAFSGLASRSTIDITRLLGIHLMLGSQHWPGYSQTPNIDGLNVRASGDSGNLRGYNQYFRNGAFEAVDVVSPVNSNVLQIPSYYIPRVVARGGDQFAAVSEVHRLTGPGVVRISMLHLGSYELGVGHDNLGPARAERASFSTPDIWIANVESRKEVLAATEDALRIVWQAFGRPGY